MVININRRKFIFYLSIKLNLLLTINKRALAEITPKSLRVAAPFNKNNKSYYGVFDIYGNVVNNVRLDFRAHDSIFIKEINKIVIISRRPNNKFYVLDLNSNAIVKEIIAPGQRHFYGHVVYSKITKLIYITENN